MSGTAVELLDCSCISLSLPELESSLAVPASNSPPLADLTDFCCLVLYHIILHKYLITHGECRPEERFNRITLCSDAC